MNSKNIGVIAILSASLMWAIEPIFAKLAYQINSDFIQTSAVRAITVTFFALFFIIITKKEKRLIIEKRNISSLFYIAIIGTILADLLYFYALTNIPVINAVLIGHMQPIFIIVMGYIILKSDKISKNDLLGILFMIISGFLVTTRTIDNILVLKLGTFEDLLVLISTIAWASTALIMRKYLKKLNAGVITFYRFLFASLFFILYFIISSNIIKINIFQILIGIIVAIGTILYYIGLKRIKAAQVSGLELSAPFFAAILGFLILGEKLTILQIIGILLLLVGIYYISKKEEIKDNL
jgi:drug/metabolite transporter (DMT)-like permease